MSSACHTAHWNYFWLFHITEKETPWPVKSMTVSHLGYWTQLVNYFTFIVQTTELIQVDCFKHHFSHQSEQIAQSWTTQQTVSCCHQGPGSSETRISFLLCNNNFRLNSSSRPQLEFKPWKMTPKINYYGHFLTLWSLENFEHILSCTMATSSFENLIMNELER